MDAWSTLRVWLGVAAASVIACAANDAPAAEPIAVHNSRHFVLHTDLPPGEAQAALTRMEAALEFAKGYWGAKPRGRIRCYLVHQQEKWRDAQLPHPLARISTGGIGGATVSEAIKVGRGARLEATIYASSAPGVVEHEVIHAYCLHAYGSTGPEWYKEGMAEVAAFRGDGVSGVRCPAERVQELRGAAPKSIAQIVNANGMTTSISNSLGTMVNKSFVSRQVPLSEWTERDAANVRQARLDYFWSWALCHLLVHNPNYSERFNVLGDSLLLQRDDSFQRAFGGVEQEMEFEFRFFLRHVDLGYRADLAAWDWRTRFRSLQRGECVQRKVLAARGYQGSALNVAAGRTYAYQADGAWSTAAGGPTTDANGDARGQGRLMGAVLSDFTLSEPFPLGAQGTFVAPASGKLYLRCHDAWSGLADNQGEVRVKLSEPAK